MGQFMSRPIDSTKVSLSRTDVMGVSQAKREMGNGAATGMSGSFMLRCKLGLEVLFRETWVL
jgi:hypothetical protein